MTVKGNLLSLKIIEFDLSDRQLHSITDICAEANYALSKDEQERVEKVIAPSSASPYATGDRVSTLYENGKKCSATILIAGKEQSKVEYNDYCSINFIAYKSDGEQEWVPNHALERR